ncbi:ParB N-terminal domain-containing protein [Photobacterium leiognathi]|uniref:hypothetical protein n=1 Tax=Photobacterium leiognathi TaxID=553611 RepID=UPI0029829FC7|nr:hypothetical protein [Photobacterium leiognathi]
MTIHQWQRHPWADDSNKVVLFPTEILSQIANPLATDTTDNLEGEVVDQEDVWRDIIENGMRDPLLVVISWRYKTIRLESGNHRVKMAKKYGVDRLPVATLVIEEMLLNPGNGSHFFDATNLIEFDRLLKQPYPYQVNLLSYLCKDAAMVNGQLNAGYWSAVLK